MLYYLGYLDMFAFFSHKRQRSVFLMSVWLMCICFISDSCIAYLFKFYIYTVTVTLDWCVKCTITYFPISIFWRIIKQCYSWIRHHLVPRLACCRHFCNKSHHSFCGVWNAWGAINYIHHARSLAILGYPSLFPLPDSPNLLQQFSHSAASTVSTVTKKRSWGINHKSWLQHFILSVTPDTADKPQKIPNGETTVGMAILDESRLKGYWKIRPGERVCNYSTFMSNAGVFLVDT